MGRRPSTPGAIPRLRIRRNADGSPRYYYDHGTVDGRRHLEALGGDRVAALQRWAELEGERLPGGERVGGYTVRDAVLRYRQRELPRKAAKTRREYDALLTRIDAVFGAVQLDALTTRDVRDWYDVTESKRGLVTANRSKAMLSALFNFARVAEMTRVQNPCAGAWGRKERGRADVLVPDALFAKVLARADAPLRRAMRLADLTGLRPADVLRLERAHIVDGNLVLRQGKTGRPWAVRIEGELAQLVDELLAMRGTAIGIAPALVRDERGYRLTAGQLRARFDKARKAAGVAKADFQFRDIRARAVTAVDLASGRQEAQRLAGHSSDRMTAHYSRATKPAKPAR